MERQPPMMLLPPGTFESCSGCWNRRTVGLRWAVWYIERKITFDSWIDGILEYSLLCHCQLHRSSMMDGHCKQRSISFINITDSIIAHQCIERSLWWATYYAHNSELFKLGIAGWRVSLFWPIGSGWRGGDGSTSGCQVWPCRGSAVAVVWRRKHRGRDRLWSSTCPLRCSQRRPHFPQNAHVQLSTVRLTLIQSRFKYISHHKCTFSLVKLE